MIEGPSDPAAPQERTPSRSGRRTRPALIAIVLAAALLVMSIWPKPWPVVTTPSGRRISHVILGHFVVADDAPVLRLKYQTELPLSDTLSLKAEARELWERFRHDVERGNYVHAAFFPQEPPSGLCFRHVGFCVYRGYGFVVRRRADGRFYFDGDSIPLP
jgi:hypothetical protein